MFQVTGIPILVNEVEILKELKAQVFEKTGKVIFSKIKPSGNNIMVCCPVHNEGNERKPSCGIQTVQIGKNPPGTVHCFACGYIDSLEGMISKCFGYEGDSFGTQWLLSNFVTGEDDRRPAIPLSLGRNNVKVQQQSFVTEEELATYRYYHPYMYQRKLTNEIIEKYDVGYQKDFIFEEGWHPTEVLTFPVRDINGNCLFVSRRSIFGKTFFLPKNLEKPVYGLYELPKNCNELVVCESVINALTAVSYGKPAVALFGTGDQHQCEILNSLPVKKFILALDPDNAGEKGIKRLKYYLNGKMLYRYRIPEGKDINDLTKEEFDALEEELVFSRNISLRRRA